MRRETSEDRAARRRRLESLGRELREAGLLREDAPDPAPDPARDETPEPAPVLVPDPGRHAGVRAPSVGDRAGEWVDERLPGHWRMGLGARHLAPLLAGLVLALGVAGWFALRSTPRVVPAPEVRTETAALTEPSATSTPLALVVVDVAGRVRHPGIARLPSGARVIDAVRQAGGARRPADLAGLNLARVLVDGEQVVVGGPPAAASGSVPTGTRVSLNTAGLEQLDALPGVGPVTAQKILDWRTEHGRFTSVDELLDVDGIGEKTLADIAPRVTL